MKAVALAALLLGCSSATDAAPDDAASPSSPAETAPAAEASLEGAAAADVVPAIEAGDPPDGGEDYADAVCGRSPAVLCPLGVLWVCYHRDAGNAECPNGTSALPSDAQTPPAGVAFCCT